MVDTATEQRLDRRFEVGSEAELELENVAGRINIRSGDPGVIEVRAEKHGSARAAESTQVEMEQTGDRVTVRTHKHTPGHGFSVLQGLSMATVHYEVVVPRGCKLRVKGISSSIDVAGTGGPASLGTVSGRINVADVTGEIALNTVSGKIQAEALVGSAMLHSTSGRIHVESSRLDSFNIKTVSGDIEVATPLTTGRQYTVHTVSGSVHIEVPSDTAATVTLKSVSGDATFELPAQVIKAARRSWQGILNGGGATLDVNSVSGSLCVAGDGSAASSHSTDSPSRSDDMKVVESESEKEAGRLDILRRLQQGEITMDEAMRQLGEME